MKEAGGYFCLTFAGRTIEQNAFPTGHHSALNIQIEYDNIVDNYNSCFGNLLVTGIGMINKKALVRYLSFDRGNVYKQKFNLLTYIMLKYWNDYWEF